MKIPTPYIALILISVAFFIIMTKSCSDTADLVREKKQMQAFYNDSLKTIRIKNLEFYNRIAELSDMEDSLDLVVKSQKQEIISKTRIIVQLQRIISSGVGDTIIVPDSSCLGLVLNFADEKPLYKLKMKAVVNTIPTFDYSLEFNPFGFTAYITRDKEGIYGGYLKVQEDFEDYIKISDFGVVLERDEFISNHSDITFLKLGISASAGINKDLKGLFNLGASALIKETHQIGYEMGLNNDYHFIRYGYYFDFLTF